MKKEVSTLRIFLVLMCSVIANAETLENIYIKDNKVAIKGTNIQLVCRISQFSSQTGIYKTDSKIVSGNLGNFLNQCVPTHCLRTKIGRYTFSVDNSHVYVSITNLTRSEDQKWWTFLNNNQRKFLELTVYTLPQTLQFDSPPSQDQDLAVNTVTFKCRTGCVYPQPNFTWFYTESGGSYQNWIASESVSSETATCPASEKTYTSAMSLARYTTFTGNIEKTVKFICGITSFVGMTEALYTNKSVNVQFAVQVINVTLIEGNSVPSEQLRVTLNVSKSLTCTTSVSRPTATVVWYIGTEEKQRSSSSTSFTFTPQNSDHNKQIYCKAFNIQQESQAVSSKHVTLYVNVPVKSVTLMDGNRIPSELLRVTSGVSKTLKCATSVSRPTATVVLLIGSEMKQPSNSGTNFTFTPQNSDHNKQIFCRAFNLNGSVVSDKSTLFVQVLATIPTLTNKTTSSLVLLENDAVKLECTSSPTRPVAIVTWRKGSDILTNIYNTNHTMTEDLVSVRSILTFTPKRSDNNETVYCETAISGQMDKPTSQQRITVYWPPSLPAIPKTDFPFLENQTGKTLDCFSTDYGNPGSKASWDSRNGSPDSSNSRILILPRLTPAMDKSQVSCQLQNNFTLVKGLQVKSLAIKLDIEYTPSVKILEQGKLAQTVTRIEGHALNLHCRADGNPVPTVRWEGQTTVSSELKFIDIDRTNHGIYTCRAEASSSKYPTNNFVAEKNVSVVVYYAPEVNITFSNTQPLENASLVITCNTVGRSNSTTSKSMKQTWNSLTIPNTHNISDGVLKIEELHLQDSGTYICIANNGIPDRYQQVDQMGKQELKVEGSPKVLLEESYRFTGAPGKSVSLSVPFYSYPDVQSVMFKFPNGSEIVNSVKYNISYVRSKVTTTFYGQQVELEGYNATLWIGDEEEYDFVNYTLVLNNRIGPMEWILFHMSESIPLVPKLLNFTGLINGVPTFLLVGNFNGGKRQAFVIETTVQGKEEWKEQLKFSETDTKFLQKEKLTYRFDIAGLSPNTYEVRAITGNVLGSINDDDAPKVTFTIEEEPVSGPSLPLGAIAGSISGVVVLAAVVAIVMIWKKRFQSKDGSSKAICQRHGDDDSSDDEVITENLAYVSAEEVSGPNALSVKMQGKEKSVPISGDIYASVNKTKAEDPGSLYAMPDKKELKNKGKGNQKGRTGKDGKKGKKKQTVNEPDNVYENAAEMKPVSTKSRMAGTDERNLYEIPEQTKPAPKKKVNKDGLIYADLDFKDQPKGQKKLIIHGLDDMTEYITVDFTKKADPLPDSDEETSGNK